MRMESASTAEVEAKGTARGATAHRVERRGRGRQRRRTAGWKGWLNAEELADKREYKLRRRLRSQTLRHMVTFLITVRSPEVVIRSAIIPPSKYSRHESSIRDVEIACAVRGYLLLPPSLPSLPLSTCISVHPRWCRSSARSSRPFAIAVAVAKGHRSRPRLFDESREKTCTLYLEKTLL